MNSLNKNESAFFNLLMLYFERTPFSDYQEFSICHLLKAQYNLSSVVSMSECCISKDSPLSNKLYLTTKMTFAPSNYLNKPGAFPAEIGTGIATLR